jgi:hypothetical protein
MGFMSVNIVGIRKYERMIRAAMSVEKNFTWREVSKKETAPNTAPLANNTHCSPTLRSGASHFMTNDT